MNPFELHLPTRIFYGKEKVAAFFDQLEEYGSHVLLVTGGGSVKRLGYFDEVIRHLERRNFAITFFEGIEPNPHAGTIDRAAALGKRHGTEFVLAFGGGSVMDASKAIAGLIHDDEEEIWPFVLGEPRHKNMTGAIPVATIPTTAATASEVTPNAVISNPAVKGKSSISYGFMKPAASWLNPAYHTSLPLRTTRDGASDILSHVFENYLLGGSASPPADRYSEGVMQTVLETLPLIEADPENDELRGRLLWTSTMALNALQLAGRKPAPFILHNMEHALSGYRPDLAHGRGLAILYPAYFRWLWEQGRVHDRLALLGEKLFGIRAGDAKKASRQFIIKFEEWLQENGLYERLSDVGIPPEAYDEIAGYAIRIYGKGKPLDAAGPLTTEGIVEIFRKTENQVITLDSEVPVAK